MVQGDYSALERQLLNQRGIIKTVINQARQQNLWVDGGSLRSPN